MKFESNEEILFTVFAYVIFGTLNDHMYRLLKLHAHSFCFAKILSKSDKTKKKD